NDGLLDGYDNDPTQINPANGTTPASYPDVNNPGNDRDWRDPVPGVDHDNDGIPDITDIDDDNDGIPDTTEAGPDPNNPVDTDGDGVPDHLVIYADNDGIGDNIECPPTGAYQPLAGTDTDGDGLQDAYDPSNGPGGPAIAPVNTDSTDSPDYLDLDT